MNYFPTPYKLDVFWTIFPHMSTPYCLTALPNVGSITHWSFKSILWLDENLQTAALLSMTITQLLSGYALASDYSDESSTTSFKKKVHESTLFYHIKSFLAGSKAICRLSNSIKKSRASSTISTAFHIQRFRRLFCTTPRKGILILQERAVPFGLLPAAEPSVSTTRTPRGLGLSLCCHTLCSGWLLRANSSSCNQIPSTSKTFAQPAPLAMEFLVFYPN